MKIENVLKRLTIFLIIFVALIALSWIAYLIDASRIKSGKISSFTYPLLHYKDGGSVYQVGIGYGVFQWNKMTNKSVNGIELHGHLVGTEIIPFPECYLNIINRRTPEHKIQLDFVNDIK